MQNSSDSLEQNAQHKGQNTGGTRGTSLNDTSRNVVMHHLSSFLDNDLEAVMSDYTNKSVLITQVATYTGLVEIKAFIAGLITHFPKLRSSLELDKIVINDGLVYIVWHAKTPTLEVALGSDTFIIKDGSIYRQTFAGELKFIDQ